MIRRLWLIFWFVLALASRAAAQDKVCDPHNPLKCSTPLAAGQPAPYSGQLLTPRLAIDLGQKADVCNSRIDLEVAYQKQLIQIPLELERKLRAQERESYQRELGLVLKKFEEAQSRPWYESPLFVAAVTATATTLLFIGAGYALREAT